MGGWIDGLGDGWLIDWKVWLIDSLMGKEPFSKEVASRGLDPLELR